MVPEHDVDPSDLYERERLELVARFRSLNTTQLATRVPATPLWTVHDVLSHVVGITADLNAQRFGEGDADAWTRAQVASRRHRSIHDLASEWDREALTFVAGLRLFGYWFGAHYLGDLLQHAFDVEAALGRSPLDHGEALPVALDFYLESFEGTLEQHVGGALAVCVGDESWVLGAGEVTASLAASRYELFRALGGRRSRSEIAQLDWSGDASQLIELVSRYPMPRVSLHESREQIG